MKNNLNDMSEEKLKRKADQEWEMAGLARQDGDSKDAQKHTSNAMEYDEELERRR